MFYRSRKVVFSLSTLVIFLVTLMGLPCLAGAQDTIVDFDHPPNGVKGLWYYESGVRFATVSSNGTVSTSNLTLYPSGGADTAPNILGAYDPDCYSQYLTAPIYAEFYLPKTTTRAGTDYVELYLGGGPAVEVAIYDKNGKLLGASIKKTNADTDRRVVFQRPQRDIYGVVIYSSKKCKAGISVGGIVWMDTLKFNKPVPLSLEVTTTQGTETNTTLPSNLRLNLTGLPSPLYADFNKPGILKKLKVKVKIVGAQQPIDLQFYLEPVAKSGGHEHDNPPRPHGWLLRPEDSQSLIVTGPTATPGITDYSSAASPLKATTAKDGTLTLTYCAPEISGQEKITVVRTDTQEKMSATITVAVPKLMALSDTNTVSVRASDTNHSNSVAFHGTENMNRAMSALALNYLSETGQKLPINDMSLPTGGLFDTGPTSTHPERKLWDYPHIGHKAGLECDLGLVPPAVNAIPNTVQLRFMQMLTDQGWWINNPKLWSSEGNHYHINLSPDNGKVTIRGVRRQAPLSNPSVTWSDAEHTTLNVACDLLNRGGVNAQSVRVDTLQLLDPSPSGVTLTSLAQTPYDLGVLAIRQTGTLQFQVLVAPAGSNLTAFRLRLTGVATITGGRTFPFAEEFIARVK